MHSLYATKRVTTKPPGRKGSMLKEKIGRNLRKIL